MYMKAAVQTVNQLQLQTCMFIHVCFRISISVVNIVDNFA
jgi:hypothetical protein